MATDIAQAYRHGCHHIMYTLAKLQSCLRPPDWRWQYSQRLASRHRLERNLLTRDPVLLAAVMYHRLLNDCHTGEQRRRLGDLFPEMERALAVHETHDYPLRWEIEARVLARQDDHAVGLACGVDAAVVATYERLFFQVRDRLDSPGWIVHKAIGQLVPNNVGAIWRHYGYFGGPLVLESLLEHYRHRGERDYSYLLRRPPRRRSATDLHAIIDHALYIQLVPVADVWKLLRRLG